MIDPRFTYAETLQTEDETRAPHGTGFAIAFALSALLWAAIVWGVL